MMRAEVIIVYDNNLFDSQLRTGFGFSCLVKLPQRNILFDTGGDSSILLYNLEQLQIAPRDIDAVVLSHAHGDHTGGLSDILEVNNPPASWGAS